MTLKTVINKISECPSKNETVGLMLRVAVSLIFTDDDGKEEILQIPGCLVVKRVRTGLIELLPPQNRRGIVSYKAVNWNQNFQDRLIGMLEKARPDLLRILGPNKKALKKAEERAKKKQSPYAEVEIED